MTPEIEKTNGRPSRDWMGVLGAMRDNKHMEQVEALKVPHQIGHGHANALVAQHRAQKPA